MNGSFCKLFCSSMGAVPQKNISAALDSFNPETPDDELLVSNSETRILRLRHGQRWHEDGMLACKVYYGQVLYFFRLQIPGHKLQNRLPG
jgi:hypothetical protein